MEVLSYRDAKKGFSYRARSKQKKDGLTVNSYLDVYKHGKKVETKHLSTDTYKRLR